MSVFPKDCWDKKCPHFKTWDMSIDDLCCKCELLNETCDACDEDYSFVECPKERSGNYEAQDWMR
jgi:hypothetical protein